MAGKSNIRPPRSSEEARAFGKKGGVESGRKRRERKAMREVLEELLTMPCDGEPDRTNQYAMAVSLVNEAIGGNVRAFESIRDTIGEKPGEKHQLLGPGGGAIGIEHGVSPGIKDFLDKLRGKEA